MSSKSSKKRERQLAVVREYQRRREHALATSPLTREQLDSLWCAVVTGIEENGYTGDFSQTQSFLRSINADVDACLHYLATNRMKNDLDVLMHCDPRLMFGSTDGQRRRMPLTKDQLHDLLDYLDTTIAQTGCDHTTKLSAQWLNDREYPVTTTLWACLALGGGCDCEILYNVEPENIYDG